MKYLALILLLLAASAFGSAISTNVINGHVRLQWVCDTNLNPVSTNFSFQIYGTSNLVTQPLAQWPVYTNINSVDAFNTNDGTFHVDLNITPWAYYFVGTASNVWGESSVTSNMVVVPMPPPVINQSLTIQKLP